MTIHDLIRRHAAEHPVMRPCDAVKLLYQGEFGAGHMAPDRETAINRLKSEMDTVKQTDVFSFETVSADLIRLPLAGLKHMGLSVDTAAALFLLACEKRGDMASFLRKADELRDMAKRGETPFSADEMEAYWHTYAEAGCPAVSHSEAYRQAYHPAYRLVPSWTEPMLPILAAIDKKRAEQSRVLVKIEGGSASGKTTLADRLARIYPAQVFHMDDYFLPAQRKTARRMAEPGGNVDYERFYQEVDSVPVGEAVRYRPFSCHEGQLLAWREEKAAPVRIVEGVYSMHPALAKADVSVFLSIDRETQRERILKRNGPEMCARFQSEWIPLEDAYFAAFGIQNACGTVLKV